MSTPKFPHLLHGGDYNPDQWLQYPDILYEDIKLMKQTNINSVSLGIFSWTAMEPSEGEFQFEWLDDIIDSLYNEGIFTVLATPSGARPAWMAKKYPEVLRVSPDRHRRLYGTRHNHCYTSPIYREKVSIINRKLANRYANHPAVILWHLSNEYNGECHCPLCQQAFRQWLMDKYKSLDELNHAWWSGFWSHTITEWEQIESPSPIGEPLVHGLNLDWRRFVTEQTIDFLRMERDIVKAANPALPTTVNLMGFYKPLNYFRLAKEVDIVSWDSYPAWHQDDDLLVAEKTAACHDIMRTMKKRSFLLMESTPSTTNWFMRCKVKRPGMHKLSSIQAIAHGSDSVQYFQWRKSRGGSEMFHGAVVDHYGKSDARVFKEVAETGKTINNIDDVYNSTVSAEVAIIFDWENWWMIDDVQGAKRDDKNYLDTIYANHTPFWKAGVATDLCDMECDISNYKLVIAPMLLMFRDGFEKKLRKYIYDGGTVVMTCWSGVVDERGLAWLGGMPGELTDVFGIRVEETDVLMAGEENHIQFKDKIYQTKGLQESLVSLGAKSICTYTGDYLKASPAFTKNSYGNGMAYYLATEPEQCFYEDFYESLICSLKVKKALEISLPNGVVASARKKDDKEYIFLQNYSPENKMIKLPALYMDMETNQMIEEVNLIPYDIKIIVRLFAWDIQ